MSCGIVEQLLKQNDLEVRRTIHNGRWWFAVVDAVAKLAEPQSPEGYRDAS